MKIRFKECSFMALEVKHTCEVAIWSDIQGETVHSVSKNAAPGEGTQNETSAVNNGQEVINQVDNVIKRQALRFLQGCAYKQSASV